MGTLNRSLLMWLLCIAATLWTGVAGAQVGSAPFYLLARNAPEGSMTAAGQGREVVYLRWDLVEGQLPPDLARIELLRGGELLLDQPVEAVMSAAEIAALYQGPLQARRLQETLTLLRELAAQDGSGAFPASGFATVIRARLDPAAPAEHRAWAYRASHADFNIARARYRGYIDAPGAGVFSYELRGVSTGGQRQRLGLVTVDTTARTELLGAAGFSQFREDQVRCDLPEAARDHHVVTLTWESPGANPTDAFAANLYLAGFDLYRTVSNVAPGLSAGALARDLAAEAAAAGFDARGNPELRGLQRVNDAPVNDPGGAVRGPKWIETPAQLARAGIRPGDRRAYYLVARDFTGHFGPTEVAVVEVPNLTRPPAPWSIRPFVDQTGSTLRVGQNLTLRWDAVNLDNYLATFGGTRRVCNLAEARTTGVLEFVGPNEDCASSARRTVRLDVAGYVVYRFPDFGSAEQFRDSDNDGVDDFVERPGGTQCDATRQPAGAESRLVWPMQIQSFELGSGRQVVRFLDQVPAGDKGRVYWYRVASYTADGRVSHLSAPVRGLFPDRELPPEPTVTAQRPGSLPNGCTATVRRTDGPWSFGIAFSDAGRTFELSCGGLSVGNFTANLLGESCEKIAADCADRIVSISYPPVIDTGGQACEAEVPAAVRFCEAGEVVVEPRFEPGLVPVETGAVTAGPVTIEVVAPNANTCVSLFQEIDGDHTRVGTSCGTEAPGQVAVEVPAGYFCGYAVAQDANNNVSTAQATPCVLVTGELKLPGMPQLLDFDVSTNAAQLRWRLPVEPLAAVLVRLEHEPADGDTRREVFSVPVAGFGAGEPVNHVRPVSGLAGEVDRWCVSLRSVGIHGMDQQGQVSEWTPRRCISRADLAETPPVYLPWPSVAGPVARTRLDAEVTSLLELYADDLTVLSIVVPRSEAVQAVAGEDGLTLLALQPMYAVELGRFSGLRSHCLRDRSEVYGYPPLPVMLCDREGRLRAEAALAPAAGFLVYRQWRHSDGRVGDWQQVSPLIEFAHWDVIPPVDIDLENQQKTQATTRLNDPFVKILPVPGVADSWRYVFFDRHPQLSGLQMILGDAERRDYRYQLVYFDERQRPVVWRESAWLKYPPEGQ